MPFARFRRRVPRLSVLLTLAVLMLAGPTRSAEAQPGDGVIKPISAREINAFAERLGLTPMQRAAIDPIHDAYKNDYAQLKRQLIDPFTARQAELNRGGPSVTREAVESMLDDQARIGTRVASLDGRFFDQVAPLLTPEQVAMLPRVRLARDRVRASASGMAMAFGGPTVDLSNLLARAKVRLGSDESLRVDEILEPYERRLTRRVISLDDKSRSMMLKLVDAMDEAGFLGMSQEDMMENPEQMQQVMEVMQRAFMDASADAREESVAILELNLDTYKRLMRILPARAAVAFRDTFMSEGIAIGVSVRGTGPSGIFMEALRTRELDEATRATLLNALSIAVGAENQLVDPLIEGFADARANIDPMNIEMNSFQEIQEQSQKATEELLKRRSSAETEVAALLGDDWRSNLAAVDEMDKGSGAGIAIAGAGGTVTGVAMEVAQSDRLTGDQFIPSRIGGRSMREMSKRVGISDDDRAIVEALHQDYREAFAALPAVDRVKEAWRDRWRTDQEEDAIARARRLNAARRAAMEEIAALEERFFADLQTTFGNDQPTADAIERERIARHAERLLSSAEKRSWSVRGGGNEGDLDLNELLGSIDLDDADRAIATEVLSDQMNAMIGVADRLFNARMQMEVAEAEWQSKLTEMEDGDPLAFSNVYQETMGPASERLEAIRSELGGLNRAGAEAIEAAISSDGRMAFRETWRRAAYPKVYGDPMCVLAHLERALEIDSLDASQREELQATLASYRGEWERLSDEIVARLRSVSVDFSDWQNVDWPVVQALEQELQQLGFDRSEQNIRAANRLRLILREEQLLQLGRLPDPDDEVIPSIWAF